MANSQKDVIVVILASSAVLRNPLQNNVIYPLDAPSSFPTSGRFLWKNSSNVGTGMLLSWHFFFKNSIFNLQAKYPLIIAYNQPARTNAALQYNTSSPLFKPILATFNIKHATDTYCQWRLRKIKIFWGT